MEANVGVTIRAFNVNDGEIHIYKTRLTMDFEPTSEIRMADVP